MLRSGPVHRIVTLDRAIGSFKVPALFHFAGAAQAEGHVAAEIERLPERQGQFFQMFADQRGGFGGHQAGTGRHFAGHRRVSGRY